MPSTPPEPRDLQNSPSGHVDPRRQLLEATLGNQYEIVRQLGQGGAGVVFLARERLLERLVAIKVLRSEIVSADTKERFVREARTAAKLMHPGIVPLYSFGQAGDTLYYIMGYVEGESLESLLARTGRSDPDLTRRILVEIGDALSYAHRNGVIHRDVKPDNILLERESGRAVLTDFGIAKLAATQSTLTATGIIVGTPLYMSPEQAAGDRRVDGRSDLYSIGVIGYRMLSGRLPFEGSSAQDVIMKHVTQDPVPLSTTAPNAPLDLTWTLMRCLDKDPARRWPTAESFRQALEAGEGASSELPEPLEHLSGSAVRVIAGGWFASLAAILVWGWTGARAWLIAAVLMVLGSIVVLAIRYQSATRLGLARDRIVGLLAAPPERWTGWWPSRWRRAGDVWEQLPASLRRARAGLTASILTLVAVFLPALILLALVAPRAGGSKTVMAAWIAVPVVMVVAIIGSFSLRFAAVGEMAARGVSTRLSKKTLWEPTVGSTLWRRPEIAHVLQPPRQKEPIDGVSEDTYCASTPVQSEIPQGMFDHIDPRSPTPLYAQIASRLRVAIAAGELAPGDGLPSVRHLAGRLRINPATVVQAYRELEVEGLVSTRQGAGTFVQDVAVDRRNRDREVEARRLIRDLLAEAGSIGITATELRQAMDAELKAGVSR